jgi:hypothetical protein
LNITDVYELGIPGIAYRVFDSRHLLVCCKQKRQLMKEIPNSLTPMNFKSSLPLAGNNKNGNKKIKENIKIISLHIQLTEKQLKRLHYFIDLDLACLTKITKRRFKICTSVLQKFSSRHRLLHLSLDTHDLLFLFLLLRDFCKYDFYNLNS